MANYKKGQTKPRESSALLPFFYRKVDDVDAVALGQRIKMVRSQQSMSLREFGDTLLLSYNTLNKIELGLVIPGGRTLVLLHELYGVDIQWLLFGCHTTHMDILNGLSNSSDEIKFDVFTRLYSYFFNTKKDKICFVPNHRNAEGVTHFSKWRDTMYCPIMDGEIMDDEVTFENKVFEEIDERKLEEYVENLTDQEKEKFFSLIKKSMEQKEK